MKTKLLLLIMVLVSGLMTMAQEHPQPVLDAFADVNRRLDTSYTPDDLVWRWREEVFVEVGLGCSWRIDTRRPIPQTTGFIVEIDIPTGETWVYHINYEPDYFIRCQPEPDVMHHSEPPITVVPTVEITNTNCNPNLAPRLIAGEMAQVTSPTTINMRQFPTINGYIVDQIETQLFFEVLDGPECADNLTWWQVERGRTRGWIAEGRNSYWVEPPFVDFNILTTDNLTALEQVQSIPYEGNDQTEIAFDTLEVGRFYIHDGTTLKSYYLDRAFPTWDSAIWVSFTERLDRDDAIVALETYDNGFSFAQYREGVSSMTVRPQGTSTSSAIIWEHVSIAPDGRRFVVFEEQHNLVVYEVGGTRFLLADIEVYSMSYSADGSRFVAVTDTNQIVWDTESWEQISTIEFNGDGILETILNDTYIIHRYDDILAGTNYMTNDDFFILDDVVSTMTLLDDSLILTMGSDLVQIALDSDRIPTWLTTFANAPAYAIDYQDRWLNIVTSEDIQIYAVRSE